MRRLPAWFVRSGTSTGLLLTRSALPPVPCQWQPILAPAMGSPDPIYGRQLDGMGSGISSTSKVVVVGPPSSSSSSSQTPLSAQHNPEAVDAEFTFVQVGIRTGTLDLAGTCGNMTAIVGPAIWDMGLVPPSRIPSAISYDPVSRSRWATLRILNTNTNKLVLSRFKLDGSPLMYEPRGEYAMDGVPGTQSPITLSFLDPAGAKTGRALPTGNPVDELLLEDGSRVKASLVDVSNPGVFITASSLGLDSANLTPSAIESNAPLKARLEQIRQAGALAMHLDPKVESVPKVVLLLDPSARISAQTDIQCLAMSMGQAHKAVPLTLALCLGAASQMDGTLAAEMMGGERKDVVRIGHPSGVVDVGTTVRRGRIEEAKLLRTARVLMKGEVYY
ncbi:DUF453 domain-containing protein [Trichoderma longibrachiatum]|uniref:DUF453-domain-containing protein n=1 Tax=Trichoderma longibrachiatum ATCC 18648 TaxID=983965 RepID=A0A2T4BUD8_TRILO|nr:DUF453-domain-containing protein [Trichoderma longibrachiatum ATCC 18648]